MRSDGESRVGVAWLRIFAGGMLLLALAPMPWGYYTLLRVVVCGVSIYSAWEAKESRSAAWVGTWAIIAVLFNPVNPISLGRAVWAPVNVLVATLFFTWRGRSLDDRRA